MVNISSQEFFGGLVHLIIPVTKIQAVLGDE
jgi:hypothetical protein